MINTQEQAQAEARRQQIVDTLTHALFSSGAIEVSQQERVAKVLGANIWGLMEISNMLTIREPAGPAMTEPVKCKWCGEVIEPCLERKSGWKHKHPWIAADYRCGGKATPAASQVCEQCGGMGESPLDITCPRCNGTGTEPSPAVPESQTGPIPEDLKAVYESSKPWIQKAGGKETVDGMIVRIIERIGRAEASVAEMVKVMYELSEFAVGNGDVCEIIARRLREAVARATRKES